MSNGGFFVVNDPKALIEAGKGKIVKKYVVVLAFANGKYYHKYQTPEPSSEGGIFGFLCFDDLSTFADKFGNHETSTLGYVRQDRSHTMWQIEVFDMGKNPCVNRNCHFLPIVVDENNKVVYYFDPRTDKFVQPGNLVFGVHPLTEFVFSNFLMKKNGDHKKNGSKIHNRKTI